MNVLRLLACAVLLLAVSAFAEDRTELRVLTYNVLADRVHLEKRLPALFQVIESSEADIIVLQEVAPWFADKLLSQPWTRAYRWLQRDGKNVIAHEFLVLSKSPILSFHTAPLPGQQHRALFFAELEVHGRKIAVATCHLESLLEDGPIRADQLDAFFQALAPYEEAFFAGDFNFGDGEQPDTAHLDKTFRDAWSELHPDKPGYTWDIELSEFARRESFPGEPSRRLDRILFKSTRWLPVSAAIIGNKPLDGDRRRLFPSDHFGLLAVFRLRPPTE